MGSSHLNQQCLQESIVRVLGPDGRVNGTGFFCHPDGYLLTCGHVIAPHVTQRVTTISLRYGSTVFSAVYVPEFSSGVGDIACLRLAPEHAGASFSYLLLDTHERVRPDHMLESLGYPIGVLGDFSEAGISILCRLGGTYPTVVAGVRVFPLMGLNLANVDAGFSGAPVLNRETGRVIGLIDARHYNNQAFYAPIAELFKVSEELRAFHDVYASIRELMRQEVEDALSRQLRRAPFVDLRIESGHAPSFSQRLSSGAGPYHSIQHWRELKSRSIENSPRTRWLMVSDVGAGKTTWLLATALRLLRETSSLPFVLTCSEAQRSKLDSWVDLHKFLQDRYAQRWEDEGIREEDIKDLVTNSLDNSELVLLWDGLDQINGQGFNALALSLFSMTTKATVLISTRPSATLGLDPEIGAAVLRLRGFSDEDTATYFADHLVEAQYILSLAPDLGRTPMLAFMVRQLSMLPQGSKIGTRTEVYQRYIDHIERGHEPNRSFYTEEWTLSHQAMAVMGALAFAAIEAEPAQLQRVELKLVEDQLKDMSEEGVVSRQIRVEDLTRFGIVNRLLEESGERYLYFTHQSFQEFLAARFVVEHLNEQRLQRIMKQRWHPKWENVLRFLAGMMGEKLVAKVLNDEDDLIRSYLLLAARMILEVKDGTREFRHALQHELLHANVCDAFLVDGLQQSLRMIKMWEATPKMPIVKRVVEFLSSSSVELRKAACSLLSGIPHESHRTVADGIALRLTSVGHAELGQMLEALLWLSPSVLSGLMDRLGEALLAAPPKHQVPILLSIRQLRTAHRDLETPRTALRIIAEIFVCSEDSIARIASDLLTGVRQQASMEAKQFCFSALGTCGVDLGKRTVERLLNLQPCAVKSVLFASLIDEGHLELLTDLLHAISKRGRKAAHDLINTLQDGKLEGEFNREWKLRVLRKIGEDGCLPGELCLHAEIKQTDDWLRTSARLALEGEVPSPERMERVVGRANGRDETRDPFWEVRLQGIHALGVAQILLTEDELGMIAAGLKDEVLIVAEAASDLLASLGSSLPERMVELLGAALLSIDNREASAVIKTLRRLEAGVAVRVLSAAATLARREKDEQGLARLTAAVQTLTYDTLLALSENSVSEKPLMRPIALTALLEVRDYWTHDHIASIASCLSDEQPATRCLSARALALCGSEMPEHLIEALGDRLDDEDGEVRRAAVNALSEAATQLSIHILNEYANRAPLAEEQGRRRSAQLPRFARSRSDSPATALIAAVDRGDHAKIEIILRALLEGEVQSELIPILKRLIRSSDQNLRQLSIKILVRIAEHDPPTVTQEIVTLLPECDDKGKFALLEMLGSFAGHLTEGGLAAIATHTCVGSGKVREAAVRVLWRSGGHLPHAVLEALGQALLHAKRKADAFSEMPFPSGLHFVADRLLEQNVRREILRVFAQCGELLPTQLVKVAAEGLFDSDKAIRESTIDVLAYAKHEVSEEQLARLVDLILDPETVVQVAALRTLSRFGRRVPAAAVNRVSKCLNAKQSVVRETAVGVLIELSKYHSQQIALIAKENLRSTDYGLSQLGLQLLRRLCEQGVVVHGD